MPRIHVCRVAAAKRFKFTEFEEESKYRRQVKEISRKMFFVRCAGAMAGVFGLGAWTARAVESGPRASVARPAPLKPRIQPERRAAAFVAKKH